MVVQKFSECFWNIDFNSTAGFDTLVKRIKDGKTSSKEIEAFVKERSKIEEDYSKSLLRLSRSSLGTTESGTLKDVLSALKADVEKASSIHSDMSQSLSELAQRLSTFRESHASKCRQAELAVKNLQSAKKDLYSKTMSSQQTYVKKSDHFEAAQKAFVSEKAQAKGGLLVPKGPKELEKLENKMGRCLEEKMKANDIYQTNVKQLERTRATWETEMENMCDVFQQVELDRITLSRNELWVFVNLDSKSLYDQDQANEDARLVMERCDPATDIQNFIRTHQTGASKPAPIIYESCDVTPGGKTMSRTAPLRPGAPSNSTFFSPDIRHHPIADDVEDSHYAPVM